MLLKIKTTEKFKLKTKLTETKKSKISSLQVTGNLFSFQTPFTFLKSILLRQMLYLQSQWIDFNPISAGGGGWNPPPSRFSPRHSHKNQPIDSELSDFYFLLSRHNLTKNQVNNLSGGHVITLLSEALCFTTYLSLYFHQIFMFYFFFF